MPEPKDLGLLDHQGNLLRHKYMCQPDSAAALCYLLPGDNYGVDGPLLYLAGRMLFSAGWDTLTVTYGYQSAAESFSPMHIPGVVEECEAALCAALDQRNYNSIVLVGKSLGAAVAALLCTTLDALKGARVVYLTPPLGTPVFDPVFLDTKQPAYLAIGSSDRFYDPEALMDLNSRKAFEYTVASDADHSIYIEGDLAGTLMAHERIILDVVRFAQQGVGDGEGSS